MLFPQVSMLNVYTTNSSVILIGILIGILIIMIAIFTSSYVIITPQVYTLRNAHQQICTCSTLVRRSYIIT